MADFKGLSDEEIESRDEVTGELDYISKIVAAISPDIYCDPSVKSTVKKLVKDNKFWQAVEKAKLIPFNPAENSKVEHHKLVYDSSLEGLEPVYFWMLDFIQDQAKVEKIIDNFASSPGSGNFSEMMGKATRMQEEAMKIMQTIGILIKSILNIIYDLKEFEIRLHHYKTAESKDKDEREAGILALKQVWLDNVDMKKGMGSINSLTRGDLNFVTLRDAFMFTNDVKNVDKIDLNDRVKRLLKPRLSEFLEWKVRSSAELKKRYQIERTYLKSQLNSLKLYTKWAQPYLKAAAQLEQRNLKTNPGLVNSFNTMILELLLFVSREVNPKDKIYGRAKELPYNFANINFKRKYFGCVFIDFAFRSYPMQAARGGYNYGGRVEVNLRSFALNDEEIKLLKDKLDESSFNESLKLAQGMTEETLAELKEDIEYFLNEDREDIDGKKENNDVNPFMALLGFYSKSGKKEEKKSKKKDKKQEEIKSDNFYEKVLRNIAQNEAKDMSWNVFDKFKKSRGWAAHAGYGEFV
jgi:hypothetical protein